MRESFVHLYHIIKKNMINLLIFEIMYRTAAFLISGYFMQTVIDFSLKKQGYSYLTAENYGKFIFHPLSVVLILAVFLLILFFMLMEAGALITCFEFSANNSKATVGDMLFGGICRTFSMIGRNKLSWILAAVLPAPVMALHLIVREVSYIKLLQFSVQQLYKAVPWHWALFFAGGVLLAVSLLFIYLLPVCFMGEKRVAEGLREAVCILGKNTGKTVGGVLLINVLVALIVGGVYLIAIVFIVLYSMLTKSSAMAAGAVLTYSRWLDIGLGLAAGAVELVLTLAFVFLIYGEQEPEAVSVWKKKILLPRHTLKGLKMRRRAAGVLTAVLLLAEGSYGIFVMVQSGQSAENIWNSVGITAHRGGALMAPENTISALRYANETLCDYAEIDVQETKDRVLVLLHDNSLKRTAGLKENIWNVTYAQVNKLDAGITFHKKFRGEKIPTLEEVINFSKGKLDLNIEIKYNGENKGIAKRVVREIEKNDFVDHCVITSMNYDFLKQVKKANPDIRTGYIMTMTYGSIANVKYADFFSVKHTYIDDDFVAEAHACGKEVHAWTVNHRGDVKRMLNCGVDNIITDNPVLVRKVLDGESDTRTGFLELMKYALRI